MNWTQQTSSEEQTLEFGVRIGRSLVGGSVIALVGPLGAGKTHLVKGIAVGNGLADRREVTSPTFVLVNEYEGRLHLYHLDVYRLQGTDELLALGFDEMARETTVVLVEWADRAPEALEGDTLWIRIQPGPAPADRRFELESTGPASDALLTAISTSG